MKSILCRYAFIAVFGTTCLMVAQRGVRAELIVGAGSSTTHVQVIDSETQAFLRSFFAYTGFTGGVRVGAGDVNNDGTADVITGAGPGGVGGHVKVFNGNTGVESASFLAYPGVMGGVHVAGGDVNGDGYADIITGTDSLLPHVKVFDGQSLGLLRSFLAYPGFNGGISVAGGDVNGDGFADIITGTGLGGVGGHVKVFNGQSGLEIASFLAYPGFAGGIYVASGDVNGDGHADIITGADSLAPHVKVFDGLTLALRHSFIAYPGFSGGVRVAAADVNGDGLADIVTGSGPGVLAEVKVFHGLTGAELSSFFPFAGFTGGVFVTGVTPVIPEPASCWFVLGCGTGLAAMRRRSRRWTSA